MEDRKARVTVALLLGACVSVAGQPRAWSACAPGGITPDSGSFLLSDGVTTYTIQNAFDVLKVIYGGLDHNGNLDCNGDVRRSMVKNWGTLFSTSCGASPVGCAVDGLRHAWRRADLDPATAAFVTMVGFGARAIGNTPFVPNPPGPTLAPRTNPFCNSYDANTTDTWVVGGPVMGPAWPQCGLNSNCAQGFACDQPTSSPPAGHCIWTQAAGGPCTSSAQCPKLVYSFNGVTGGFSGCNTTTGLCTTSDGGISDYQADWDPIRVRCLTPTTSPFGFDEVCSVDSTNLTTRGGGSLGLVLPLVLPDVANIPSTQEYPTVDCDPNTCDLVPPTTPASHIPPGFLCPDGNPPVLNRCWAPYHQDPTVATRQYNCRADKRTDHCFGLPNGLANGEGRAYNKAQMKLDGTGQNLIDAEGRIMSSSFYRLRGTLNTRTPFSSPIPGTNVDPTPCTAATAYATQVACLTAADTCSTGM
jgi:hypothetical protein